MDAGNGIETKPGHDDEGGNEGHETSDMVQQHDIFLPAKILCKEEC